MNGKYFPNMEVVSPGSDKALEKSFPVASTNLSVAASISRDTDNNHAGGRIKGANEFFFVFV